MEDTKQVELSELELALFKTVVRCLSDCGLKNEHAVIVGHKIARSHYEAVKCKVIFNGHFKTPEGQVFTELLEWLPFVKPEHLTEDYRIIINTIGLDAAVKLAYALPKIHLYLQCPEKTFKRAKEAFALSKMAEANLEGQSNIRHIALKTGLSERHLYELLQGGKEALKKQ